MDSQKSSVARIGMTDDTEHVMPSIPDNHGGETLKRVHNVWTASAYQVLMMASWTCNIVLYTTVFDVGGPMMLIYGTLIVCIGQCLMMASLAEVCSVWPYAGGQQEFTKKLAPRSVSRSLSYVLGYIVLLGEVATSAGCAMNNAIIIDAIVQINHPEHSYERWQVWLIYAAFVVISMVFSITQSHLPALSVIGGAITLFGGIAWAISFLLLAPKQSASFVFKQFINNSGYQNVGWVGLMSFYTPVYALYGTDGVLHIVEEIKDPERNAPRAMIWSMIISGITSLIGSLILAFCAGNWQAYLESEVAFLNWFIDILGSTSGGIVLAVTVIVTLNVLITIGINTAASRLAWSMARDNALPWSNQFSKVHATFQTPLNAIMLTIVTELFIGLVVFGSDYAFQAIVSIGGAAIQISYLVPIMMLLVRGRDVLSPNRVFSLGKMGLYINIVSVIWSTLVVIILFFPLYVPVTGASIYNMNWAIAVFGGVVLIVLVDWVFRGRFNYLITSVTSD